MLVENASPAELQQARRLSAAEHLMPSVLSRCLWETGTIEAALDSYVNELRIIFGERDFDAPSKEWVFEFLDAVDREITARSFIDVD